MSTSSSEADQLRPGLLALKLIGATALIVALSYCMEFAARELGMGDAFKHACAHQGYLTAMEEKQADILVIGASDAMALDPNLAGTPAGVVVLRGAGLSALMTGMEFLADREPNLRHIMLVVNPINLASDTGAGLGFLSELFGWRFNLWLLEQNPTAHYRFILGNLLKTDIWQSTFKSTRDLNIGDADRRCDEIAARNGMQLIIARKVYPAESAAAEALRHGRRLADSQADTARIINENITRLQELIAVLENQGIAVSVILPPVFIDYRQNLGVDEIVEQTKKKMQIVDLTRTFDDRPQLFRDATHIEWPEGTVLATEAALSQIRP